MDRSELESLVRIHQAAIYRYARYVGADAVAAEDIVQETFLAAFRGRAIPGTGSSAEAAWLRGIARNIFLQHCRRARTGPITADSDFLEQAEAAWSGEFLRSDDGFDYVEALHQCLETLSPEQRRIIEQRYAEKKSREEMARQAGLSENGIKSVLRRIRATLAECIRKRLKLEQA